MALRRFKDHSPRVHPSCFVEDSAQVIGDVELGEDSSVWFNSVLRGDVNPIRIGRRTNIQDLSMIHVTSERYATFIGDDVTVGHHVVLHGCTRWATACWWAWAPSSWTAWRSATTASSAPARC